MLSIPQYLLESSFCLAIFYGFYHLFLKKETFFQLNRAYLLATPIAALSIPLLNISFQKDAPPESLEAFFYPAIQSANNLNEVVWEQMRAPSPVFSLSVADIIMAIYLVGIFLMSFSLLKGLWNLGRIIRRGKRSKNNEFTLVETQNNFPAASFFGYIFWNQQITDEQKLILEHEKVHIRQWHSLDVLLMEICVILKWFNPLIYWFRNALKVTHEFIADQYVIEQKSNVSEYATLLVNQHKQQVATPLINTFSALTKKRLRKMIQQPSRKVSAVKYLLLFPLLIGLMSLFSFNLLEEIPRVSEGLAEMNSVLGDIGDKTVFEIDQPFLTEESTVLSQAEKRTSEYEIQLGEFKYNAGNATKFNSLDHKNDLTLKEIQTLLDNPVLFTKEGEKLDLYKIDLVIPNLNISYSTTHRSTTIWSEGEEEAFIIEATETEGFKFTKSATNSFLKNIHDGSIFYINGYGKSEVFISEFLVDYATGEISNKEMDRYFYFPKNPNNNKLQIGHEEISIRGLKTGGTAAPARINQLEFFKSLREGSLKFIQNGQPLMLDELYLTHVSDKNNYTANIIKNAAGKFEISTSFDTPPFSIKTNEKGRTLFSEEIIQKIEASIEDFDLIELRGKNKEDTFLKTIFFSEKALQYNRNNNFESTVKNPIFDTPSLINNQQLKFKWGSIEFPIWHRDNPYFKNKSGTHVSVEKLIENLTAEMKVLDGKKVFDVHSMSLDFVFYNNKEKDDPAYIFTPPFKLLFKQGDKMKLFPTNQETLTKYINNFGKIYIKIPELGSFHSFIIEVGESERPIPIIPESDATIYTYQVIMPKYRKKGKTVLRIDTTMVKNKRIVDMYRNPDRYHTIHIPNFQTMENLLWEDTDQIIKDDLNDWTGHSIINPLKSEYNGHIGAYSFSVGNGMAFDNETYKHRITDYRLGELLSQSIRFTKNGAALDMDGVEIVIPYPGAVYDFDHTPYTEEAFINNGSDDGKPFRMTTNRAKGFQFSAEDLAKFKKIIQQGTKVYLNGYVGKEILTSHFHVLDAKGFEQAKNNLSELGAEMRQESPYKLQLGNTVIGLRATNSARMSGMNFLTANELIQGLQKNNLQFLNGGKFMNMEKVELVGTNPDNEYGWNWSRNDDGTWQLSEDYAKKPIKIRANTSSNNKFSEGDIAKLIAVLPDLTGLHFYGRIEDTLYSANVFIRQEKKKVMNSQYQLKWGKHDLPIILNKDTNSTVASFITQTDFEASMNKPFELLKNGRELKNKTIELTLFNTENGSSWGIDKMNGLQFKYWELIIGNHATFTLNSSEKTRFTKEEIGQIKSFIEEGWLLTIRATDDYQLYSSIRIVEPNSMLLTRQ